MPFARIEIEQVEGARWVAEIEAGGVLGGPNFKREHLTADSFEAMMRRVAEAYAASQVVKAGVHVLPDGRTVDVTLHPRDGRSYVSSAEPASLPTPRDEDLRKDDIAKPSPFMLDQLRAKAEELGLNPDRRWGEARLAREIAEAEAARDG